MPSEDERRLHPLSFVFALGSQARAFLIPAILFAFTASYVAWQLMLLPFVALYAVAALVRSLSFRYRYADDEIVIRTGFFFRNERHIPYQRIQNIDAVENVFHRMLGVAEVRVETAGGQEPEATMKVLPIAALEEMRRRALGPRRVVAEVDSVQRPHIVLKLGPRELLLHGLIQNRGMVLIGALFGLVWELGILGRLTSGMFGPTSPGRGVVRSALDAWFNGQRASPGNLALGLLALLAFLVLVRLTSMAWAATKLHGFTLTRTGSDLQTDFGLFTRVSGTIPLGRIQTLTIHDGPLHRLGKRASVRVETAGNRGTGEEAAPSREWLAPVIRPRDLPSFLAEILPGMDIDALTWQPVHPRAFRRALKPSSLVAIVMAALVMLAPGWWDLVVVALLPAWAYMHARHSVAHLGYAVTDRALWFRSGWIWRSTTVAPFAKLQAVMLRESPFDRRSAMASVSIDTAGATAAPHRIDIPYLGLEVARELHRRLSFEAARTAFRW